MTCDEKCHLSTSLLATASSCSLSSAMEGGSSVEVGSALIVGVAAEAEGVAGGGIREDSALTWGEAGSGLVGGLVTNT